MQNLADEAIKMQIWTPFSIFPPSIFKIFKTKTSQHPQILTILGQIWDFQMS